MKKITNLIPAVLFAIAFCWAAGQWAGAAEPYLDGNKSIAQTWIYAENKGTPDRADVTITIRGEGDPVTEIVPQDVVFAIDSSGSMLESDPLEERLTAAKFYVDQLDINLGEKAAVVDFDDLARLVNDHHLCTDTAQVKADIDTIDMIGGTNILSAMAIANDELAGYGDPDHVWVVILLTDGQNWCMPWGTPCPELDQQMDDVNDPLIQEAINNHIAYYTIGLGSDVNETLLSNLATFTGGQYYSAPDASYLREIYDEIHQRAGTAAAGRNITVT
jgi:Mg-chelatase subunit ChlD